MWLAFDIGTTGAKAALLDGGGRIVRSVVREYPTDTRDGGVMEQNAADWWDAAVEATRQLAPKNVEAIAITGQMQDVILLDERGDLLRPVILYSDTRARAEADEINARIGVERLRSLTGNDQDASGLLAKLLWLQRQQPALLIVAHQLLMGAADYLTLQLTDHAVTDSTTASTTGLMDIASRTVLSSDIFDEIGIRQTSRLIPPIKAGGMVAGGLTQSAAMALGLRAGIPIYHGPGDAGAATLGAGCGETGSAYIYVGTSGWIAFTDETRAKPEKGVITLAHPKDGRFIPIAPLLTAGGNLEWVRDLFCSDEYDSLIDSAAQRPPSGLLYLPYLNGERIPFRDPLARGAFIGMNTRTEKADLYRAVLEGVIYAYRHAMDALMPAPPKTLTMTGGGTRSTAWCQLFADVIGLPVTIAGDAENVGVRGAVLAAQAAIGEHDSYYPENYFPTATTLSPDPEHRTYYDHHYALFRETYPALRSIFARMANPEIEIPYRT